MSPSPESTKLGRVSKGKHQQEAHIIFGTWPPLGHSASSLRLPCPRHFCSSLPCFRRVLPLHAHASFFADAPRLECMRTCDRSAGEIERLRNVQRKRVAREAPGTPVTKNTWDTAVCIGLLADYDFRASVCWLKCKRRRGVALPKYTSWEELLAQVRDYFLEADVERLHALQDAATTPLTKSMYKNGGEFCS